MDAMMISETPAGRDFTARWGWSEAEFQRIAAFGASLRAAIRADSRGDGPRARRLKAEFRRGFGATETDLATLEYTDRHWQREGLEAARGVAEQAKAAEFLAMLALAP